MLIFDCGRLPADDYDERSDERGDRHNIYIKSSPFPVGVG